MISFVVDNSGLIGELSNLLFPMCTIFLLKSMAPLLYFMEHVSIASIFSSRFPFSQNNPFLCHVEFRESFKMK